MKLIKRIFGAWQTWLVFFIYLALAIWTTWPIILEMKTHMFAVYGDALGGLWGTWWFKQAIWNLKISPLWTPFFAAPYTAYVAFARLPFDHLIVLPVNILWGDVFAYNFLILASYVLAGLGMYWFVFYLTKNRLAAFVAGVIFAFSPYHWVRAAGHWDLAQIQWLPFFFLFLIKFDKERKIKDLIWLIIFAIIVYMTLPYHAFLVPFILAIYLLIKVLFWFQNPRKNRFKFLIVGVLLVLGIIIGAKMMTDFRKTHGQKPIEEFYIYSLKPHDYLLPSVHNPYFGEWAEKIVWKDLGVNGNTTEKTAYLGFIPFLLAILGAVTYFKKDKQLTLFFVLAALLAFWASLAPFVEIWGKKIPTLSYLIYLIAPAARSVNRYSLFVQMFVSLLAGLGLTFILLKIKNIYWQLLVLILILLPLLLIEYRNGPNPILDVSKVPPVYQWLKKQPGDFIILEYPPINTAGYSWGEYAFFQRYHEKRMMNDFFTNISATTIPKDERGIWTGLDNLLSLFNPDILAGLRKNGVKYLIVHYKIPYSNIQYATQYNDLLKADPNWKFIDFFGPVKGTPFGVEGEATSQAAVFELRSTPITNTTNN